VASGVPDFEFGKISPMILWLILALMTAAAIVAVILPLARRSDLVRSGGEVAVYRDQLDEVERDHTAGLIGAPEADAARIEISRRLLAAAEDDAASPAPPSASTALRRRRVVAFVSLLLLPFGTGGLYAWLGSPGLVFGPASAQDSVTADRQMKVESLVSKVEGHLRAHPEDGRGWEVLAPVYMQLGRYTDSANAWRNALRLLGEDADREANLGEALMADANGVVTEDAKTAFVRAVTLDSTTVSARFYLGVAAEQDGDRAKAAKIWRDLIADAPSGAHWVGDVRTALARVENRAVAPLPGPTPTEMVAAAKQPSTEQFAMIRSMVDGLAAQLKHDSSNVDGWVRLVRSYKVLGEADKADAAVAEAQKALAGNAEKRQQLDAGLKALENEQSIAMTGAAPGARTSAGPTSGHDKTISDMVERLAERLKRSGGDPEGWLMLIRSYATIGETDKANAAIADARKALAAEPTKLDAFNNAVARFNVGVPTELTADLATPPLSDSRPPAQANELINTMVARLADRLKQDGSDVDGWMRLVRSYVVLGERYKARHAAADARRAIGDDIEKRRRFDEFEKNLGLGG